MGAHVPPDEIPPGALYSECLKIGAHLSLQDTTIYMYWHAPLVPRAPRPPPASWKLDPSYATAEHIPSE